MRNNERRFVYLTNVYSESLSSILKITLAKQSQALLLLAIEFNISPFRSVQGFSRGWNPHAYKRLIFWWKDPFFQGLSLLYLLNYLTYEHASVEVKRFLANNITFIWVLPILSLSAPNTKIYKESYIFFSWDENAILLVPSLSSLHIQWKFRWLFIIRWWNTAKKPQLLNNYNYTYKQQQFRVFEQAYKVWGKVECVHELPSSL